MVHSEHTFSKMNNSDQGYGEGQRGWHLTQAFCAKIPTQGETGDRKNVGLSLNLHSYDTAGGILSGNHMSYTPRGSHGECRLCGQTAAGREIPAPAPLAV